MAEINWLNMLANRQKLHYFSRTMLTQGQKRLLTASELEILSILYLETEENTPVALSRQSGMKKEAVSRSLKQLFEKEYVAKTKHPQDERSYILKLTEKGREALKDSYAPILQPLYDLRRKMGGDFDKLFELIGKANECLEINDKRN